MAGFCYGPAMTFPTQTPFDVLRRLAGMAVVILAAGCATPPSVNWDERVGTYSWQDALAELGQPTLVTNMEGGVKVAEWVKARGPQSPGEDTLPTYTRAEVVTPNDTAGMFAPDKVLRLMFTPDGKLIDWDRNY